MSDPIDEIRACRAEVEEMIHDELAKVHAKVDSKSLTPTEIEAIAEKASDKAIEKLTTMAYLEIGKGVVTKTLKVLGIIAAFAAFYFHDKLFPK